MKYDFRKIRGDFMAVRKKVFIGAGVLVLAIVVIVMIMNGKGGKADSLKIATGPYSQNILAVGKLVPALETELKSEVSGNVLKADASEGAAVSKNDILFVIDNKDAGFNVTERLAGYQTAKAQYADLTSAQLPEAKQKLAQAEAEKTAATDLYNDSVTLYQEGAISQNDFLDAESRYQAALSLYDVALHNFESFSGNGSLRSQSLAQLNSAKAAYDQAVADAGKYQIKAGQDGVLIKKLIEAGSYVQPGQTLAFTASLDDFYVTTELDERYFAYVKVGMKADISVGEGAKYSGSVSSVSAKIDESTGTFGVRIALAKDFPDKAAGLTVNIDITLDTQPSVISIPQSYLVKDADGSFYVWKYVGGKVSKTPVVTGPALTQTLLIKSGLAEGDIIVSPTPALKDGGTVSI